MLRELRKRAFAPAAQALCLILAGACSAGGAAPGVSSTAGLDTGFQVLGLEELLDDLEPREGDRAVLVNFWATWCKPCVAELPDLVRVTEELEEDGLRVVAVSLDLAAPAGPIDTAEKVEDFARKRGFDLPIVVFDGDLLALSERLDLPGPIPFTRIVDASGKLAAAHMGPLDAEGFRRLARKALGTAE